MDNVSKMGSRNGSPSRVDHQNRRTRSRPTSCRLPKDVVHRGTLPLSLLSSSLEQEQEMKKVQNGNSNNNNRRGRRRGSSDDNKKSVSKARAQCCLPIFLSENQEYEEYMWKIFMMDPSNENTIYLNVAHYKKIWDSKTELWRYSPELFIGKVLCIIALGLVTQIDLYFEPVDRLVRLKDLKVNEAKTREEAIRQRIKELCQKNDVTYTEHSISTAASSFPPKSEELGVKRVYGKHLTDSNNVSPRSRNYLDYKERKAREEDRALEEKLMKMVETENLITAEKLRKDVREKLMGRRLSVASPSLEGWGSSWTSRPTQVADGSSESSDRVVERVVRES